MDWTGPRIKALRNRYGQTQEQFAEHFRVPVGTLRWWEQSQGDPPGPATVILDQLEAECAEAAAVKAG